MGEMWSSFVEDYNTATMPHKKFYDLARWNQKQARKLAKAGIGQERTVFDDEKQRLVEEREDAQRRAAKEMQDTLAAMDSTKIATMRSQERLKAQMQALYRQGHVEEAKA